MSKSVCDFLKPLLQLLAVAILLTPIAQADQISPFTSDGCSAFPDGNFEEGLLWLHCCEAHDYAYWKGGSFTQREEADVALQQCVAKKGQAPTALIMLVGVRIGGSPLFPSSFRWGYGWSYPRWYKILSDKELLQIETSEN